MAQQVAVCLAGRVFSLPLAPSPGFSLQPMSVSVYMLWPLDFFVDAQDLATAKVTVTIETAPDLCPVGGRGGWMGRGRGRFDPDVFTLLC